MTAAHANAREVIARLGLQPHPEGDWYRETWRGAPAEGQVRGVATSILFLLEAGQRSHWHRVDAAEIWLHQGGGALKLLTSVEGETAELRLGPDILGGDQLQHVVPAHAWQAAEAQESWVLVACVVAPAFEFSGFEMAPPGWGARLACSGVIPGVQAPPDMRLAGAADRSRHKQLVGGCLRGS
ncbi:MAG: cupin domain-containing protein [Caulobacteraceae bacterium]